MWWSGWGEIGRTLAVGTAAYVGLVVLLRASGKRTLSKMNAFDLVVTVALGSTLATVLLSKQTALATGMSAFALLIGLQWLVAFSASRSRFVSRMVKSTPRLLLWRGELQHDAMRTERVNDDEVLAAVRQAGIVAPARAEAVVLETDGTLSVIPAPAGDIPRDHHSPEIGSSLERVAGVPDRSAA